jgi:chemotaxis protein methyltransferase CheR
MNRIALQDGTFRELADFIYERTGIYIPPHKKYLVESRLVKVIEDYNLKGYDEFLYLVKYSSNGREVTRLFDAITTNETYFFREPLQLDVFIDAVVSKVIEEKRGTNDIRVWSAACSTGDEPYTISMLMKEKRSTVRADIMGSDISPAVLESAQKGVFSSYSVRNVPELYMEKYFRKEEQDFILDPEIRNSVRFKNINLIDKGEVAGSGMVDVIFCRNVLIYFDDKAKRKAVSFLYDSLRPGGYLLIGSAESLHNVTRAFMPGTINRVLVYQKV